VRSQRQVKAAAAAVLFPLVEPAVAELEGALRAVVAAGDSGAWSAARRPFAAARRRPAKETGSGGCF